MRREGVASTEEFEKWLAEEKEWLMLKKNSKKSQETSLEMEYVQKLVNLSSSEYVFQVYFCDSFFLDMGPEQNC